MTTTHEILAWLALPGPRVLVLAGLPGCGKSTLRAMLATETGALCIETDRIWESGGRFTSAEARAAAVRARADMALDGAVESAERVIVDACSVSLDERARWLRVVDARAPVACAWWAPDLAVSLTHRSHLQALVERLAGAWETPTEAEGFDRTMEVER